MMTLRHDGFLKEAENNMATIAQKIKERGRIKGKLAGKQKGRLEAKLEFAQRLLSKGVELAFIAKMTGLPLEKIEELKNKQKH